MNILCQVIYFQASNKLLRKAYNNTQWAGFLRAKGRAREERGEDRGALKISKVILTSQRDIFKYTLGIHPYQEFRSSVLTTLEDSSSQVEPNTSLFTCTHSHSLPLKLLLATISGNFIKMLSLISKQTSQFRYPNLYSFSHLYSELCYL